MAKKGSKTVQEAEPLKLFYIFYNQERYDNWLKSLSEASFDADPKSDEMPEGFRILDSFSVDITLEVLKIIRLFQNNRFTKEESLDRLGQVEVIIMATPPEGDLAEIIEILQLQKLVLFASCRKFISGTYDKEIKSLVKKGREILDKDMEGALDCAAQIGAGVLGGASCCSKYVKDDLENPTLFDEWLIECERMNDAIASLKNFDETVGDED
ncbi:MAG TPA: DUF2150 family protein [Methanoregulaceae archaeon]|nr:DUF2150 family protein [Methanoregulaceae archaeon]HRY76164.1 DUF2150 family protein [Methanoregulaceae archaeon]